MVDLDPDSTHNQTDSLDSNTNQPEEFQRMWLALNLTINKKGINESREGSLVFFHDYFSCGSRLRMISAFGLLGLVETLAHNNNRQRSVAFRTGDA